PLLERVRRLLLGLQLVLEALRAALRCAFQRAERVVEADARLGPGWGFVSDGRLERWVDGGPAVTARARDRERRHAPRVSEKRRSVAQPTGLGVEAGQDG